MAWTSVNCGCDCGCMVRVAVNSQAKLMKKKCRLCRDGKHDRRTEIMEIWREKNR